MSVIMVVNMRANKCHLCLLLGTLSKQEGIFIQSVMLSGLMTVILLLYSPYFYSIIIVVASLLPVVLNSGEADENDINPFVPRHRIDPFGLIL
jgi:hypothetical protein